MDNLLAVKLEMPLPTKIYNEWDNYFEYVVLICVGNFVAFIFTWLLHKIKAAGVMPYRGPGQGSVIRS